ARATGESAAELRTHYNLGSLYFEQSDFEQAEHAYRRAYTRAREIGRPWAAFGMDARAMVGLVQYIRGDWDGALRTLDVANESATPQAEALYAATAMTIRAGRGDRSALELLMPLRDWWERESRAALYSVGAALDVYQLDGRSDEAIALLDELVGVLTVVWQNPRFLAR